MKSTWLTTNINFYLLLPKGTVFYYVDNGVACWDVKKELEKAYEYPLACFKKYERRRGEIWLAYMKEGPSFIVPLSSCTFQVMGTSPSGEEFLDEFEWDFTWLIDHLNEITDEKGLLIT